MAATAAAAPPTPAEVLADLSADEPVSRVSAVRVATSPGEPTRAFSGVAVLTTQRLAIVPGAPGSPARGGPQLGDLPEVLRGLWSLVKPAVVEAFPMVRMLTSERPARLHLAARQRPGIEIPVHMIRRAFEAHVPCWLGLELALPLPDPRPPFCIYVELVGDREAPRRWRELLEAGRTDARPAPELERPYALYYLFRDVPKPRVRVAGPDGARFGAFFLGTDGLTIGRANALDLPFEAITALAWAPPSRWRRATLAIVAGERSWAIEPSAARETWQVHDIAHLLSELSGVPLQDTRGSLRAARIVAWATAAGTAGAAVLYELLHFLL